MCLGTELKTEQTLCCAAFEISKLKKKNRKTDRLGVITLDDASAAAAVAATSRSSRNSTMSPTSSCNQNTILALSIDLMTSKIGNNIFTAPCGTADVFPIWAKNTKFKLRNGGVLEIGIHFIALIYMCIYDMYRLPFSIRCDSFMGPQKWKALSWAVQSLLKDTCLAHFGYMSSLSGRCEGRDTELQLGGVANWAIRAWPEYASFALTWLNSSISRC